MLFARYWLLPVLCVSTALPVEPGLPSKTAIFSAIHRAIGAKNPDPSFRNPDFFAIKFLGPRERAILANDFPMKALDSDFETAVRMHPMPYMITGNLGRTRYFDHALEEALHSGVLQVVVLGAGFDSRAYRFQDRLRDVRLFEVDYGPTQEYKKERVKEILGSLPAHVRYVAVDFAKDDLSVKLRQAGYSERKKTFFLWEGVVYYIRESAVRNTLRFVRDHSAPQSTIAFDYALSRNPFVNNPDTIYARWGEPWIFGFPGEGAAEFVKHEGLEVVEDNVLTRSSADKQNEGRPSLPSGPGALMGGTAGRCIARVPRRIQ